MESAAAGTPSSCESLTAFSFKNTTINSATSYPAGPYAAPDTWHFVFENLPPYCDVYATIKPTADSATNVHVWMATGRSNGRFLGTGGGGYAGNFFFSELADGINRGFATANPDMGTGGDGIAADNDVGHPEKWRDFGHRATHLMTTFSKALINAFYGDPAQHNYFTGCSTGGQQALMEAQRHPEDYDGVLVGDPAHNRTHLQPWWLQPTPPHIKPHRALFLRPSSIWSIRPCWPNVSGRIPAPLRATRSSPTLVIVISIRHSFFARALTDRHA